MENPNLETLLADLKAASNDDQEYLMAHFLLLLPQLEALDQAIENSIDTALIEDTAEIRNLIPDLINRIIHIVGQ